MATKRLWFLTTKQVELLHTLLVIPRSAPVQPTLLESAIYSPMNLKHYAKTEDVFQLAANFAEKLMKNHPFQDGNKRTALVAADMFLKINGYSLLKEPFSNDPNNKGLADAHVAVVTNQWTTQQLANYYKSMAVPVGPLTAQILEYKSSVIEY
ncbi:DOC family protein [Penicillium digitatum PHI26]|uniref:DOC family protein n=3 Tax=Penicillium digitatum TaxID=36651 RepID=K9GQ05_PEND2|nr:DOC family protein [Penicillium digitatum Pd1]EKV04139.1 DOC family protein [Penicillium digitatum Pd1]EKV16763.1 DOC family protein [Penicillium digitatum PHI26]